MDYYRHSLCCPGNLAITMTNLELAVLESIKSTIKFNHSYMEFVGYKVCGELLWTLGMVDRGKKTLSSKVKYQLV